MAKIPTTQINDASLRANPYLALQQSGQIRPGEGAVQADQTFAQIGEVLGNVAKYADAKFASEDKRSILEHSTAFDKLLAETKMYVAEGDPAIAEDTFANAIAGFKEHISSDESISAVTRENVLAHIAKASITPTVQVHSSALVKAGKIELAALENWSNQQYMSTLDIMREGDDLDGTQAVANYLTAMEEGKDKYLASTGTVFISKDAAETAWRTQFSQGFAGVLEGMITQNSPAYKSQIEDALANTEIPLANWSQLNRLHQQHVAGWDLEETNEKLEAVKANINNATGEISGYLRTVYKATGNNPMMQALDSTEAMLQSDSDLDKGQVQKSARQGIDAFFTSNYENLSLEDIDNAVERFKGHNIFTGATEIDWDNVAVRAKQVKQRQTVELLDAVTTNFITAENGDALLTGSSIEKQFKMLGDGEGLIMNLGAGEFREMTLKEAKLGVLKQRLNGLSYYALRGDDDHKNFEAVVAYIQDDLNMGSEIRDVISADNRKKGTLSFYEDASAQYRDAVSKGEPSLENMVDQLDTQISADINQLLLTNPDEAVNQLLGAAQNGDILQAHSDYADMLIEQKQYDKLFAFMEDVSKHDIGHVNEIFGKSQFEHLSNSSVKETLANVFRYGTDSAKDHVKAIMSIDPQDLGYLATLSKEFDNIGAGRWDKDDEHAQSFADIRNRIDGLSGQPEGVGINWTADEASRYSNTAAIAIQMHFGGGSNTATEEIAAYVQTEEFATDYMNILNEQGAVYNTLGPSNQTPQAILDNATPEQQKQIRNDAALNVPSYHEIVLSRKTMEQQASSTNLTSSAMGGVVMEWIDGWNGVMGVMAREVVEHSGDNLIDFSNAFILNQDQQTDLTKGNYEGSLYLVPFKRGNVVAGYMVAQVTDDGIKPYEADGVKNGIVSIDMHSDYDVADSTSQAQLDFYKSQSLYSRNVPSTHRDKEMDLEQRITAYVNSLGIMQ